MATELTKPVKRFYRTRSVDLRDGHWTMHPMGVLEFKAEGSRQPDYIDLDEIQRLLMERKRKISDARTIAEQPAADAPPVEEVTQAVLDHLHDTQKSHYQHIKKAVDQQLGVDTTPPILKAALRVLEKQNELRFSRGDMSYELVSGGKHNTTSKGAHNRDTSTTTAGRGGRSSKGGHH